MSGPVDLKNRGPDAVRASRNRPAGTPKWKKKNVNTEIHAQHLFERVVPAIMDEWPRNGNLRIRLQRDNAPSHSAPDVLRETWLLWKPVLLEDVHGGNLDLDFFLRSQPANSPDSNLNGLSCFVSAKAECWKNPANNANEMIERLAEIFAACPHHKLNQGFLTLMTRMSSIVECNGGNNCAIPHTNKAGCTTLEVLCVFRIIE